MRFLLIPLITLLLPSIAMAQDAVTGHWLTENERAVIEIKPCEESICGAVYWIIEGGLEFDQNNPSPELQTRKICGLTILEGFEKARPGDWDGGTIYKADDGDTYSANLELQDDGTLKLRGYVGFSFLGKSQIWKRVQPNDYKRCE